jgi:hypothetical protein
MTNPKPRLRFAAFYREVFLPEHTHPLNRALHMAGTVAGLAYVLWVLTWPPSAGWLALVLFPAVHALPGLLGHRLVERNAAVGDARWRRTDFPAWWFIVGNHRMTLEGLRSLWLRRP